MLVKLIYIVLSEVVFVHRIAKKILNKLLEFELISVYKKENYLYGIEMILMKALGIFIIGIIAIITKKYVETIVFYFIFKSLRTYTNGYHSRYYWSCLIESTVIYIGICLLISPFVIKYIMKSYFVTVVAMILIFLLSPVNFGGITFNDKEIKKHKEVIKYILIIDNIFLFIFMNYKVRFEIVAFFEIAIILDLILIIIAKIINVLKYVKSRDNF
ncbi:MAG: accessory gene regulator B family protein [Filifactoraceae bacterium]